MAGQDQSRNLSGMLGGISETLGNYGEGYKGVLQQASKPRGDMNDPMHLQNLAQWASSNGDAAAASMYMTQARELTAKAEAARKSEGQGKVADLMTQIRDVESAEGMDPFARNAESRALSAQLAQTAEEYQLDPTRFVGYSDGVRDEAIRREAAIASRDATVRANNERATIERLNRLYSAGDTEALENALTTLEQDEQATLVRDFREGIQRVEDAERIRDEHARERNEKEHHNRPLTEEELEEAKKFGIKPEAYPSIGMARSKINDSRVMDAKAQMSSKSSKTVATGVLETMMPQILRELAAEASSFDDYRFTPGDDGLTDFINEELLDNDAIMKEIAAFVSAQGVEQGEQAAQQVRKLVIEHLKARAGEDGWIESLPIIGGGIQSDLRKLSGMTADDYLN